MFQGTTSSRFATVFATILPQIDESCTSTRGMASAVALADDDDADGGAPSQAMRAVALGEGDDDDGGAPTRECLACAAALPQSAYSAKQ